MVGGGVRIYTRPEVAPQVEMFLFDGQRGKLTQAALETLAVMAYRQPVTRSRVSAIRGVNVDGVVRTLTSRGLVVEAGADPETGGGLLRTTELFLERMGLQSLDELPSLAPMLPDLEGFGGPGCRRNLNRRLRLKARVASGCRRCWQPLDSGRGESARTSSPAAASRSTGRSPTSWGSGLIRWSTRSTSTATGSTCAATWCTWP